MLQKQVFLLFAVSLLIASSRAEELTEDDVRWRQKIGYNPSVHGTLPNTSDHDVIARLPYAYYPTDNRLEVIFDAATAAGCARAGIEGCAPSRGA